MTVHSWPPCIVILKAEEAELTQAELTQAELTSNNRFSLCYVVAVKAFEKTVKPVGLTLLPYV